MALNLNGVELEKHLQRFQEDRLRRFQEEQERRFAEVRRILGDPELVALLREVLQPDTAPAPLRIVAHDHQSAQLERGAQTRAIRKEIAEAAGQFTTPGIGEGVRAKGFELSNIAVGKVLRRLESAEEIRIVRQGAGSEPNTYERTDKFRLIEDDKVLGIFDLSRVGE